MSVLGFRILRRPTISTPRGERHRQRRLLLETLEDRALLASSIAEFPLSSHAGAALLGPVSGSTHTISATAESTAHLQLSMKASSNTVVAGGTVTYTINVTNTGNDPAADVQVVDKLPPGFTFVSGDPTFGSHVEGNRVVNDLGTINPGATVTVRIRLMAKAGVSHHLSGGKIKNIVTATWNAPDGLSAASTTASSASASISTIVAANLMPPNQVGKDAQSAIKAAAPKTLGTTALKLNLGGVSLSSLTADGATRTIVGVVKISYSIPMLFTLPGTIKFSASYSNPTSNNVKVNASIGEDYGKFLSNADYSKVVTAVRAAVLAFVKKDKALIMKAIT